jgi:hypothetical protein
MTNWKYRLPCMGIALFWLLLIAGTALAQDDHPAFGPTHHTAITADAEVADIPKLEAKAIDILRTKYGLTLAEARDKVRIDGRTDVARCLEFVYINALQGIAQAKVVATAIANQHPTAPLDLPAESP